MKKHLSLFVVAAAIAAPVFAEGIYAGGEIGRTNVKGSGNVGAVVKGNATNFGVFGGYQFHPNVAVEAGYRDLGKVKKSVSNGANSVDVSLKSRALHASLVGIVPVSDEFSLYGRLGVARLNTKGTTNGTLGGQKFIVTGSENHTKPMFGFGARYAVSKEFGLRTEYTQFGKIEGVKISTLTVGGDYAF